MQVFLHNILDDNKKIIQRVNYAFYLGPISITPKHLENFDKYRNIIANYLNPGKFWKLVTILTWIRPWSEEK